MQTGKSLLAQRVAALSPAQLQDFQRRLREKACPPELQPRAADERVPLSSGQQRFWLLDHLTPENPAYNETNSMRFRFALDVDVFRRAVNEIVRRHEVLRMSVEEVDGVAFQRFASTLTLAIPVVDLRYLPATEAEAEVARLAAEQSRRTFNLRTGPLVQASLYRMGAADFVFVLTLHHMVCDGWSLGVFMVELLALYGSFVAGQPSPLPELSIQYGDFALWQQRYVSRCGQHSQLSYWRERLCDLPTLPFPADRPRPPEFTFRGARESIEIAGTSFAAMTELARHQNTTLFNVLFAGFCVLLHRYMQADDFAVGVPTAGRSHRELERLIGCFINTLVMRIDASGQPSFLDFLDRVRQTTAGAYANQDVQFEGLVEALQPKRDPSRNPLVQVMFQLFTQPSSAGLGEAALLPFTPVDSAISKLDLTVELIWTEQRIRGHVEYNTDLFDRGRIVRLIAHFQRLLESVAADPSQSISQLPILTEQERKQLLVASNGTAVPFPRDSTLAEVFAEQVRKAPEAPALRCDEITLSYRELSERAAAVARAITLRGIAPGANVGLYLERSLDLPIVLLGILEAGCAYVPLDPSHPRERIAYLLADSGVKGVLTTVGRAGDLVDFSGPVITLEDIAATPGARSNDDAFNGSKRQAGANDLAYIMYTSGTTGKPKGVAVTQRNVLRLVKGIRYANVDGGQTVLQFAPASFDASTFEIWGCLLNGGVLAMYPSGVPSLEDLGAFIKREKITLLFLTTNLFAQMVEHCSADLRDVGQVLTGGEVLPLSVATAAWKRLPRSRLANAYGPTECTTFATMYPIGGPETLQDPVPIGRPIENTTAYVLDRYGNLMPVGVPGELHLGGDGVVAQYWGRPELTAEKFLPDPFVPGGRLYRTGDIACFREDGNLLFLGRRDRQVKLNGFRVELGEVEAALLAHPDVRAAVVLVSASPEKRLTAFCESRAESGINVAELRGFLTRKVPHYMMPARIEVLENLPLNANGKVDTDALARREVGAPRRNHASAVARNPLEQSLGEMWADILTLEQRVGESDNFFELGGHSLLAMRILSRVRKELGVQVTMREFFDRPTTEGLAEIIAQKLARGGGAAVAAEQERR